MLLAKFTSILILALAFPRGRDPLGDLLAHLELESLKRGFKGNERVWM